MCTLSVHTTLTRSEWELPSFMLAWICKQEPVAARSFCEMYLMPTVCVYVSDSSLAQVRLWWQSDVLSTEALTSGREGSVPRRTWNCCYQATHLSELWEFLSATRFFFPGNSCSNQVEHHQCIAQRRQDTLWPLAQCTRHPLGLCLGILSPVLPSAWRSPTSTATGNVLPSVPSSSL